MLGLKFNALNFIPGTHMVEDLGEDGCGREGHDVVWRMENKLVHWTVGSGSSCLHNGIILNTVL